MLIGVGGSGKQSLAKLAVYMTELTPMMIVISKSYSLNDFKTDLQVQPEPLAMYLSSSVLLVALVFHDSYKWSNSQLTNLPGVAVVCDVHPQCVPAQTMFTKSGIKGQGVGFLFTDNQIVQERFLVSVCIEFAISTFGSVLYVHAFSA